MKKRQINIDELISFLGDEVVRVCGDIHGVYIDNLADVEHVNETTLDWIKPTNPNKQSIVEKSPAHVILVDEEIKPVQGKALIVVKHPKMALAKVGNQFFVEKPEIGIHPTAIIHSEAIIGSNVSIGAYCMIGRVTIGDGCVIDSHVRIYDDVVIGKNCNIKAGAVIGGAGFGFERDGNGNKFRFPQIGSVRIGDDVEIGSQTCIDRGALSDTVIGDHTKISNLCHIAHNNRIGRNVTITCCVNLSGGNIIEDDVWIAPNASLVGYVHIGEKTTIGLGAVVVKDVPAKEVWVGNPARKLKNK
jgi:UDP-3-O-[3-hydroxymyristoyl] glucosamine N-acyltransferase